MSFPTPLRRFAPVALAAILAAPSAFAGLTCSTDLWIAAAAKATADGGAVFATDLRLFNPGPTSAHVELTWLPAGQDNSAALPVTLDLTPGETHAIDDAVGTLFSATGAGGIRVVADRPVAVASRTFNQTATGTFAQFIPARNTAEALGEGATATLLGTARSASFRTNVGFLDVSGEGAEAVITVRDGAGVVLGTLPTGVAPYGFNQFNPFVQLGIENAPNARVDVEVTRGRLLTYASVVDNSTSDPNFVEPALVWAGDGAVEAVASVAATSTRVYRGAMRLAIVDDTVDAIVAWDQVYEGKKGDGTGCTALLDLATATGRGIPIAADGSFFANLSGSWGTLEIGGTFASDGGAAGSFTANVTSGSCTGTAAGSFTGQRVE